MLTSLTMELHEQKMGCSLEKNLVTTRGFRTLPVERLMCVLALLLLCLARASQSHATDLPVELKLVGTMAQPDSFALSAAGIPPDDIDEAEAWAVDALERVINAYHVEGYSAVRGWFAIDGNVITLEIDEGRIQRIAFIGANVYEQIIYRDNIGLELGILHEPTLQESLERLEQAHGLRGITYRVEEEDEWAPNQLGMLVPERALYVMLVSEEQQGLGLSISIDPSWGFLGGIEYDAANVFEERDHFHTFFDIGFPLQEYVFEQEPQIRWVYGAVGADHLFSPVEGTTLSPNAALTVSLINHRRLDIGLAESLVLRSQALAGIRFGQGDPFLSFLGLGVEGIHLASAELEPSFSLGEPDGLFRPFARGWTEWVFNDGTLRRDLRDSLTLAGTAAVSTEGRSQWRFELTGQFVATLGRDNLLFRGRGVYLAGDIHFYDELPLAGTLQRTYFADLYWVHEAAQIEVAYRVGVASRFKVGMFHDVSLFLDRTRPEQPFSMANSFGPSVHLLLLDYFAFDLHYGFGFSPNGPSHNMTLGLSSVY